MELNHTKPQKPQLQKPCHNLVGSFSFCCNEVNALDFKDMNIFKISDATKPKIAFDVSHKRNQRSKENYISIYNPYVISIFCAKIKCNTKSL